MSHFEITFDKEVQELCAGTVIDVSVEELDRLTTELGGPIADSTRPIQINLIPDYPDMHYVKVVAFQDGATRTITVGIGKFLIAPDIAPHWLKIPAALRSERTVNETIVHEMVHAVDFDDRQLQQEQAEYEGLLTACKTTKLGVGFYYLRQLVFGPQLDKNSPLEKRDYGMTAERRKTGRIPRIVSYNER
jgi:hypothetical protein